MFSQSRLPALYSPDINWLTSDHGTDAEWNDSTKNRQSCAYLFTGSSKRSHVRTLAACDDFVPSPVTNERLPTDRFSRLCDVIQKRIQPSGHGISTVHINPFSGTAIRGRTRACNCSLGFVSVSGRGLAIFQPIPPADSLTACLTKGR
jgi:hypothetical protein